jgi:hypothetical protein
MKKNIFIILMLFVLLFVLASCNDTNGSTDTNSQIIDTSSDILSSDTDNTEVKIEKITDFPEFASMRKDADQIIITYTPNGMFAEMVITDKESINNIMEKVHKSTFKNVGDKIPTGGDTFRLDIKDGENSFVVCECILYNGSYYEFRGTDIEEALENAMYPPNKYVENGCENPVSPTRVDVNEYYRQLRLGNYIGENVPSGSNNGYNFEIGLYYDVILNHSEASLSFSNTTELNSRFFENYYILAIGIYISTGMPYDIYGFYDMYYDFNSQVVRISLEGRDGFEKTDAYSIHNYFLKIPKDDNTDEFWKDKQSGKLEWSFHEGDYIDTYNSYASNKKVDVKQLTAWSLTSKEEINEFGSYYSISPLENWKREDTYLIVIYMKDPCTACFVGFKDLNISGERVYITAERSDYNHNHSGDKSYFVAIEIKKSATLYEILPNATVTLLTELNQIQYIE